MNSVLEYELAVSVLSQLLESGLITKEEYDNICMEAVRKLKKD